MIYCIIGNTCSGKTTIAKMLSDRLNIERIKTYTTRPKRPNESFDEYVFVTNEEFEAMADNFIEIREYEVANGDIWKYATLNDIDPKKDYIKVVDTTGYLALSNYYDCKPIIIQCSDEDLKKRAKKRFDDELEFARRLKDDKEKLDYFLLNEVDNQIMVNNDDSNLEMAVNTIESVIKATRKNRLHIDKYLIASIAANIILLAALILK